MKTIMSSTNTVTVLFALLLTLGSSVGCQGTGDAEVSQDEGALALDSCAGATPDAYLDFPSSPPVSSSTIYSNPRCAKSWVVQMLYPFSTTTQFFVFWKDQRPRTKVECVGGTLNLRLLSQASIGWADLTHVSADLLWSEDTQTCAYPFFAIPYPDTQARTSELMTVWVDQASGHEVGTTNHQPLPYVVGKTLKAIVQALTPHGTTQGVSAEL